jgi:hypothetical protein
MIQIDTNEQIVNIGIELGQFKRAIIDDFVDTFDLLEDDDWVITYLDHGLELWLKYYELTKPLECYTFTFDNSKPKK